MDTPQRGIVKPDGTTITVGDKVRIKQGARRRVADHWLRQGPYPDRRGLSPTLWSIVNEDLIVVKTSTTELTVHPSSDGLLEFQVPNTDVVKVPHV
jgi:hypothetical protein